MSQDVSEAVAAVQVGLYVSAARCLLTYVVAPVAGAIGILLGPLGLILLLLGAVTSTAGARRLWLLGHRARIPYAAIALAVCVLSVISRPIRRRGHPMTTETTATADTQTPEQRPDRRTTKRRTGRPVRRLFIVTHRWISLTLGLVLLTITMSGAVLLYRPEIQRWLHQDAYEASGTPATVSLTQARRTVLDAHPKFPATSVWAEHGVYRVTDYETSWTVNPGTGKILGHIGETAAWLQLMDNIHECFCRVRSTRGTWASW